MQQKLSINNNNNNVIQRAKLHTPDRSSGENTRSRLAEHASSIFRWFLYCVQKQRVLSSSLEFDCLSRVFCITNTWKSSAAARTKISKRQVFVSYKKQQNIICVKAKNFYRIDICLAEKLKSVMANKCFHLATSSYNE